jgi:WD40 repeat protein
LTINKILTLTRDKHIKAFNLKSKTHANNPNSPFTIEASFEKDLPASYCNLLDNFNMKDSTFQILDEVELLLGKGTHIVRGGLWNGTIVIWSIETGKMEILRAHTSTVTWISVDEKEKLAISGSKKGDIIFWEIDDNKLKWK